MFKENNILMTYIKGHPLWWILSLILPPCFSLLSQLVAASISKNLMSSLTQNTATYVSIITVVGFGFIGILISNTCLRVSQYFNEKFKLLIEKQLKIDVFKKLMHGNIKKMESYSSGELVNRQSYDTNTAVKFVTDDLYNVVSPLIIGIGSIIAIFILNWIIGLVALVFVICVILFNKIYAPHFEVIEKEKIDINDEFTNIIMNTLRGKMTIRTLAISSTMTRKIEDKSNELSENAIELIELSKKKAITMDWFVYASATLILPLACLIRSFGLITLPNIIFITQICGGLIWNTKSLGTAIIEMNNDKISTRRVQEIISIPDESDSEKKILKTDNSEIINFLNVNIGYEGKSVLKNTSFTIKKGDFTAIVGNSGSGKSSILKAILGLTEYDGNIKVFDIDLNDNSIRSFREKIAYVPQNNDVISGTILENIVLGNEFASREEVSQVMKKAALYEFLDSLDTQVGESGDKISGGQRQRIAIARGLLKNSPLILLDEPTAALDTSSEKIVLDTLENLSEKGYTIVMVTHRKEAIKRVKSILFVEKGHVTTNLSYDEVLKRLNEIT